MSKELYKYYSLNECMDTEKVFKHLEPLNESGKIYFEESDETLMLEDIELSEGLKCQSNWGIIWTSIVCFALFLIAAFVFILILEILGVSVA